MKVLEQRARSYKLLSRKFNTKEGVIKINTHNTFEHELAKFITCWKLALEGKEFVTEAIFENGKRADVFVLDDMEALEILKSESEEDFNLKIEEYPCPAFALVAEEVIEEGLGR